MAGDKILTSLGEELKSAREGKKLSLQAVSEPAKISATYLQKLEKGIVRSPSPHVLRRIGKVLDIPYLRLMMLSGYINRGLIQSAKHTDMVAEETESMLDGLNKKELESVRAFIRYLKEERK